MSYYQVWDGTNWLEVDVAGTAFPGSPWDGQPFYRTDLGLAYHYDVTAAGWILDYVHPNHSGDVTSVGDGATTIAANAVTTTKIINDAVTDAKLRDSAALSVIGRSANSTGDPADIAASAASAAVLRESGSTIGFGAVATAGISDDAVTNAKLADMAANTVKVRNDAATGDPVDLAMATQSICARQGANILAMNVAASRWVGRLAAGNLAAQTMADMLVELMSVLAGTSFPGSPIDGQPYYRTDHGMAYHYDTTAAGWLSDSVYECIFGCAGDITGAALKFGEVAANLVFDNIRGYLYNFNVKCVGLSVSMAVNVVTTDCHIEAYDGITPLGATGRLVVAVGVNKGAIETLLSTTITAGNLIGFGVTAGTCEGAARGVGRFRRFET